MCRSSLLPFEVLFFQWVCGFVSHQRRYGFPHLLDKNKVVCASKGRKLKVCATKNAYTELTLIYKPKQRIDNMNVENPPPYMQWGLPPGAKARLGKGGLEEVR